MRFCFFSCWRDNFTALQALVAQIPYSDMDFGADSLRPGNRTERYPQAVFRDVTSASRRSIRAAFVSSASSVLFAEPFESPSCGSTEKDSFDPASTCVLLREKKDQHLHPPQLVYRQAPKFPLDYEPTDNGQAPAGARADAEVAQKLTSSSHSSHCKSLMPMDGWDRLFAVQE